MRAVEQLDPQELTANHNIAYVVKSLVMAISIDYGECLGPVQDKLRGAAAALRVLIDRDIVSIASWHWSTGHYGSQVAASLFGRDEDGSAFAFKQKDMDALSERHSPRACNLATPQCLPRAPEAGSQC